MWAEEVGVLGCVTNGSFRDLPDWASGFQMLGGMVAPSHAWVHAVEFGIEVARRELCREALYRWQRAVEIDPTYAAAFNNLAIAYERLGDFEQARDAYERAVELEPDNLIIQQNYDLFREINDRASSSDDR